MVELRKGKLNDLQAKEQLQDTVVLGTMMLALDHVDGLVSGQFIQPPIQCVQRSS